ncbi:MAG: V-type ATP synthase subunit F, partial [Methanocella sp.]
YGFQLAGVQVRVADDVREARQQLVSLINDDQVGLIALDDALMEAVDNPLRERLDRVYRPVLIPIPSHRSAAEVSEERRQYIRHLIRRAVGFDIRLTPTRNQG